MKSSKLLALLMLVALTFVNVTAKNQITNEIVVKQKERSLLAPEASKYQWYYNGQKTPFANKEILVTAAGTYKVEMTDASGALSTMSVTVGLNAVGEIYTIFIIGDSTVSNWWESVYPLTGWGQVLQNFFNGGVVIDNRAISGRSAKSFYNDHWSDVIDDVQAGDYVLVQFGINDANKNDPNRYAEPWTGFQDYLSLFVSETQAKGATCVLVATLRRNAWNATTPPTLYDSYHDYPVATRALAQDLNVPLIDLDAESVPLYTPLGPDYVGPFMYLISEPGELPNYPNGSGDNVHFQEMGAIEMARLVVQEIQDEASSFSSISLLTPSIKPMYQVAVNKNNASAGMVTRTASYPSGIRVTLKAVPNSGYTFTGWQNSSGSIVSTNKIYSFTMGSSATSYTAVFSGGGGCNPTSIVPYLQVNGGAWQQTSSVTIDPGSSVKFGPQPVSGGSWSWNGCGTSGSSREQTVSPTSSCTATATYTNSCGAQSTQNFNVTVNGSSGGSYYRLRNRATGLFLDGMGRTNNGDNVGQWANTNSTNSQWTLESIDGYYKLGNRASGLYLDGMGRTVNGEACGQWAGGNSYNQQWERISTDGYYRFRNRATGLYLDGMGRTQNGADVGQWSNTTSINAQWELVSSISSSPRDGLVSNAELKIYPVPSHGGKFTIDISNMLEVDKVNIEIYSSEGKRIYYREYAEKTKIDLNLPLDKGIYLVVVKSGNQVLNNKLLVQ